jgi:DNA-binding MarR family transcriptional regulator
MLINSPPIDAQRCNCAAIRKASRRVAQMYDAALAPADLRSTQFAVLAEIERRTDTPPTMRELADALVLDRSTLGQNLRPLQRDNLIAIQTGSTDRRRRLVVLTTKGKSRLGLAKPLWNAAQRQFETRFGERAAANLRQILLGIADDRVLPAPDATSGSAYVR